ncbi:MAG: hypothetical protein AAF518_05380 [Spirochaetota bacterium]
MAVKALRKSNRKRQTPAAAKRKKLVCKSLLVINEKPIRQKATQKAKRAIKELEKSDQLLSDFNQKDRPAFQKWYNSHFGKELTALREMETSLANLTSQLEDIEFLSYARQITYYEATILWQKHKNDTQFMEREKQCYYDKVHSENSYSEEDLEDEFFDDEDQDFDESDSTSWSDDFSRENFQVKSDEELEEDFKEFLEFEMGINYINSKSKKYKQAFTDFKEEYYEFLKQFGIKTPQKSGETPEDAGSLASRLKERYRTLARMLHPDLRRGEKENRKKDKLWHDTQDAYQREDMEALDMILAVCYIYEKKKFQFSSSISDILKIAEKYKADTKVLKSQIRKLKKDIAWNFSSLKNRKPIEQQIRHELKDTKGELEGEKRHLQRILKRWQTPPKNQKKPKEKKQKAKKEKFYQQETLFQFI